MKLLRVLIADDDSDDRKATLKALQQLARESKPPVDVEAIQAETEQEAINKYAPGRFDLVVLDLRFHDHDALGEAGLRVLRAIRHVSKDQPVIVMSQVPSAEKPKEGVGLGAKYVTKRTHDPESFPSYLRAPVGEVLKKLWDVNPPPPVVPDPADVLSQIETYAPDETLPILLVGDPGTGKTTLAERIHELSPRRKGPFVVLDLGTLNPNLIEDALFGSMPYSSTGAAPREKKGLADAADGGTLFLDEIANLRFESQPKLLRLIRQKKFKRVGGDKDITVDIRFVAATNQNLDVAIAEKRFLPDLRYRLAKEGEGMTIEVPPLRKRKDLARVALGILHALCQERKISPVPAIAPEVYPMLEKHTWPGHLGELKGVLKRAINIIRSAEREMIETGDIDIAGHPVAPSGPGPHLGPRPDLPAKFNAYLMLLELIDQHQKAADGKLSVDELASVMGMAKSTYFRNIVAAFCARCLLRRGITDKEATQSLDYSTLHQEVTADLRPAHPNVKVTEDECRATCSGLWTGGIGGIRKDS